jgi:nucleotide-binding universal stress UspA family protein
MATKRILIGVDGSKNALRAVDLVTDIASKIGASVTLLNVIATSEKALFAGKSSGTLKEGGGNRHPQVDIDIEARMPTMGEERLQAAIGKIKGKGVEFDTALEFGHPADVILSYASKGYDLIVVGSRGLGSIEGLLMGSISTKVVHHSKVPVLVVP